MKRILVASAVLALVGAVVPWNGSAGAAVAPAPEHRTYDGVLLRAGR